MELPRTADRELGGVKLDPLEETAQGENSRRSATSKEKYEEAPATKKENLLAKTTKKKKILRTYRIQKKLPYNLQKKLQNFGRKDVGRRGGSAK